MHRLRRHISRKKYLIAIVIVLLFALIDIRWWFLQPLATTHQNSQQKAVATQQEISYLDQTLAKMSLRDKVASLFIIHTPGTVPARLAMYYDTYKPGGLIFMEDNIPATLAQLRAETDALSTGELKPLLAIDEEGDTVKRLASDTFPGALTLPDLPPSATKAAFSQRSQLLKSVGFNLNFGIVADETTDPNSFIFPRVLGTTPQAAADRVGQAVLGSKGLTLSTLKHFPGHGETPANSHLIVPAAATTLAKWQQGPAIPFISGIKAGADVVMFGQLSYTPVDIQPATLSKTWHDILRNQLSFKGLTVTDDMIMLQNSGDPAYADPVSNAVAALNAGNDLLLYVLDHDSPNSRINPDKLIDGVVAAVRDGKIKQSLIDDDVRAVLTIRHGL